MQPVVNGGTHLKFGDLSYLVYLLSTEYFVPSHQILEELRMRKDFIEIKKSKM